MLPSYHIVCVKGNYTDIRLNYELPGGMRFYWLCLHKVQITLSAVQWGTFWYKTLEATKQCQLEWTQIACVWPERRLFKKWMLACFSSSLKSTEEMRLFPDWRLRFESHKWTVVCYLRTETRSANKGLLNSWFATVAYFCNVLTTYSFDLQTDPRNEAELRTNTYHSQGCLHTYITRLHRPWLRDPQCLQNLSFSPFSRSWSRSLSAFQLKERRFYPPADLWYTPFRRLHASYITRLKQSCCNERYLGGTRSLRNSSVWYREDFANPQLKAKCKIIAKPTFHHRARSDEVICVQITSRDGDNVAHPWCFRQFSGAKIMRRRSQTISITHFINCRRVHVCACVRRDRTVGDPENDAITVAVICHSRALHTGKSHSSKRQWISITLGEFSRGSGCDINNLQRAAACASARLY